MGEGLKNKVEDIKDQKPYSDEAYGAPNHRVEEISYEDSWKRKVKLSGWLKELKKWNEVHEERRFNKYFKGFVKVLLELL